MIITEQLVDEAVALLSKQADGSNANKQAREAAKRVIAQHAKNLDSLSSKNPSTYVGKLLAKKARLFRMFLK